MSDLPIAITSGSQSFSASTAAVVISVIDMKATHAKGRMVLKSARRAMEDQVEIPEEFAKFTMGEREQNQIGATMDIIAHKDQETSRNGIWTHKIGGIANGTLLNISIRSSVQGHSEVAQDTVIMCSTFAPMIRLVSDFPYEEDAVTGRYQIFKGNAWLLAVKHLKEYELKPKPQYAMRYLDMVKADEDLLYLTCDEDLSDKDMYPQVTTGRTRSDNAIKLIPKDAPRKRQVRRRRG